MAKTITNRLIIINRQIENTPVSTGGNNANKEAAFPIDTDINSRR